MAHVLSINRKKTVLINTMPLILLMPPDFNDIAHLADEVVIIGANVMLTMSVSLRGDNKTHQSTIWQLYAPEVSAELLRSRCGRSGDTAAIMPCRFTPVCEILITLNNLLIYPQSQRQTHTHTQKQTPIFQLP